MYEFIDRMVNIALPRIKDFRGLPTKGFDKFGNYTFGVKEHIIFPEVNFDKVEKIRGLDISIIILSKNKDHSLELLKKFNFPFKNGTLYLLLAVNMFTGPVLIIPLYKMLRALSLLNTYYAMIVPGVAFLIPTSIWLLKSYFQKIPIELEEAAHVDGASRLQILRHIIAPLSTPGLAVVGIYAFIGAYAQQFLFAISFNQKKEFMPLPAGLYEFIGYQTVKWNEMMAASLVGILPVLLVFIFLQKYIVEGLTVGAVKN